MPKFKILHVDDDPDVRDVTRLILNLDACFEVDSVESAADALISIEESRPELILLDVMMPGMDGPSLFRALRCRQATADLKVIFMTAISDRDKLDELFSLSPLGVISKPFDPITLADEIKYLLVHNLVEAP